MSGYDAKIAVRREVAERLLSGELHLAQPSTVQPRNTARRPAKPTPAIHNQPTTRSGSEQAMSWAEYKREQKMAGLAAKVREANRRRDAEHEKTIRQVAERLRQFNRKARERELERMSRNVGASMEARRVAREQDAARVAAEREERIANARAAGGLVPNNEQGWALRDFMLRRPQC